MKPDIYAVEQIGEGLLSVMAKPVSGGGDEVYELGLQNEQSLAEKNAMQFLSYPIKDRGLPESILDYSVFIQRLYKDLLHGINTVIHCRAGIGRTGIVAAGVLLHCGYDAKSAFSCISAKRRVSVPDTQEQIDWVVNHSMAILAG
ncbi:MAG: protein-tyrosine phosphatase family protein [Arenicella sp.]